MRDWWKAFFTPAVYPLPSLVNEKATEKEVRELLRRLPVGRGASVLDVACGVGRHAVALARRGYEVTGVDYSSGYLAETRRRAGRLGVRFLRRDMRRLGFESRFDAVINLWTSFGYFKSPRDDREALRSMLRALKPGGWLALDVVDAGWLKRHFRPRDWHEIQDGWQLGRNELRGGADPASISDWVFVRKGRISRGRSVVRLYDRARLKKALRAAGFEQILLMNGLLEEGSGSSRIFALARRPG